MYQSLFRLPDNLHTYRSHIVALLRTDWQVIRENIVLLILRFVGTKTKSGTVLKIFQI